MEHGRLVMKLVKEKNVVWNVGNITYAAASLLNTVDGEWADSMRERLFSLWEEITQEHDKLADEYIRQLDLMIGEK
jgi:hypothetical protein